MRKLYRVAEWFYTSAAFLLVVSLGVRAQGQTPPSEGG